MINPPVVGGRSEGEPIPRTSTEAGGSLKAVVDPRAVGPPVGGILAHPLRRIAYSRSFCVAFNRTVLHIVANISSLVSTRYGSNAAYHRIAGAAARFVGFVAW